MFYLDAVFSIRRKTVAGYVTKDERGKYAKET